MNRAAAWLCMLGLLCLHSGGLLGQDLEEEPEVLVFCDDPVVSMVAKAAVTSFNERLYNGVPIALYLTLSASKAENASGAMYSIKFNSRKSDCPAGGAVPWTDCGYLADDVKEPIMCNATVYVSEGVTSTQVVECDLEDAVLKDRATCLGCPVDLDLESEDLKVPISVSVSKYNSKTNHTHLFMLQAVGYATRQVVAGLRYRLYFDMRKSNCSKADNVDLHPGCVHDSDAVELANCNSTVDIADWRHEVPQASLTCDKGPMEPEIFTRRRPPGWSPLRSNVLVPKTGTPIVSLDPSAAPQATPTNEKEDSSEEKVSQDHPFHCPSKPWKKFSPPGPSGISGSAGQDPPAGTNPALTDLDLLG